MKIKLRGMAPWVVSGLTLLVLQGAAGDKGGCGGGLDNRAGEPGLEVGGAAGADWDVSYGDALEVLVKNGAVVVSSQALSLATGGTFDLAGTTVELRALCARGDIACPEDVFPARVRMTQPGSKLHLLYVTFNQVGPLDALTQATLLGNVDSDYDFSIALGVGAAGAGSCGLLKVSYATGTIAHDDAEPPRGSALSGEIVTAYAGGCIALGQQGSAAAGLTVEFRLPFSAKRR
ncbi:MAG: hypothetical protein IPL40_06945 [Proteobacteria bacterium]|nr:hypothetical protein [Pseudomonadota bacterium]